MKPDSSRINESLCELRMLELSKKLSFCVELNIMLFSSITSAPFPSDYRLLWSTDLHNGKSALWKM